MSRRLRLGVTAAVAAVGLVLVAIAFSRSLIPYRIDGTLESVGVVSGTGQRERTATVDGRTYVVDNPRLVDRVGVGRHLSKDAWSTTLTLDGQKSFRLSVGDEVFQFLALTLVASGATWFLTGSGRAGPGRER